MTRTRAFVILLVASALTLPEAAFGQLATLPQYHPEFNFSSPGARSLALGGAFVALADDATAAYSNPAGLVNLSRPEVSVEGRHWKYTQIYPTRGHAFGPLSAQGGFDNTSGILNGEASSAVDGLSFLSVVYPYKGWSFGLYRHELANFAAHFDTQGPYFNSDPGLARFFPTRTRADLKIVNLGLSAGYRLTDRLSVGLGISRYEFSLDVATRSFFFPNPVLTGVGGPFGPPDFSSGNVINVRRQAGSGNTFGGNLGVLWKVTDNWSLGAVYREKVKFDTLVTNSAGGPVQTPPFKVPEIYTIATAFKPTEQLTATFDVNRIRYSDNFDPQFPQVRIDDADEFHTGLEYVLLTKFPVSLRAGAFFDPDHQPSFRGLPDGTTNQRALAVLFPRGDSGWHYSGGIGLVIGEKFQLDAAFDISKRVDTVSLSTVYRF